MTGMPLTLIEARHILEDQRMTCWAAHTMELGNLARVLCGHPVPEHNIPAGRPVDDATAFRALDWCHDTYQRPPTPREAHDALDQVTSSPDTIRDHIDAARTALAAAKARRAQDHERLRREADQRRKRAS